MPVSLALVAWAAVAFNWYILRAGRQEPTIPISSDDARLDITKIEPVVDDEVKAVLVNYVLSNNGRASAIGMRHQGVVGTATVVMSPSDIDAFFVTLKAQLIADKTESTVEIQPGQTGVWFTIPPVRTQNLDNYTSYKEGRGFLYAAAVLRYRDRIIGEGRHIYTESCVYLVNKIQHFCEGHNQTYIAE